MNKPLIVMVVSGFLAATALLILAATALLILAVALLSRPAPRVGWRTSPQLAGGQWTIWVQTPPCEAPAGNLHVDLPKFSGEPLIVMCDALPVPVKQSR